MSNLPARFRRNALSNYANAASALVIALLMTPVLVHGLGKNAYGIWVLVGSTVQYFDLLKFGLGRAAVNYVATGAALEDEGLVRRTITTSFTILLLPGTVFLALAPALAFLFPVLFDVPSELKVAAMICVVLVVADLAAAIPADTFGSTLIGLQRYDLLSATVVATAVAQAVGWAIVLALGGGIVALGVVTLSLSLASQVVRYVLVGHLITGLRIAREYFDRTLVRPLATLSGWIALAQLSEIIINRIDTIIVGIFVGVPEAGVYAVGQKLATFAGRFIDPALGTLYPHASKLAASNDLPGLRSTLSAGTRIALGLAGPLTLALAVLARPAIQAWVGPGFGAATLVVVYLGAATFIHSITIAGTNILRGAGDVKVPALFASAESVLNLTLSVVLAHTMGLTGVALATLIAAAVTQLVLFLPYICRKLEVSLPAVLLGLVRTHLVPVTAAIAVGLGLRSIGVSGILEVLGAGAAVSLVYVAALVATGLSRAERRRFYRAVRRRAFLPRSP